MLNRKKPTPLPSLVNLANHFSNFFTEKIQNVISTLPNTGGINIPQITNNTLDTLSPTSFDEIRSIIMSSSSKSSELDPIPTSLLKQCLPAILPSIVTIINTSLDLGIVPEAMKTAAVRPTLKKSNLNSECLQNYRPISNLSYLSKLAERVAFSRLRTYFIHNNLIDNFQSAYRPHHSVETLLTNLVDSVLSEMDKGNITLLVLLDMSSAFDTIDHKILVKRLNSFGITGTALQWFTSYIENRTQYVSVNNTKSDKSRLLYGVPQGSVGGPLLFSVYLQPISTIIKNHNIRYHCYADDIQLFVSVPPSSDAIAEAMKSIETCICAMTDWMNSNSLKMNESKTEFMILGSKNSLMKANHNQLVLHVGNQAILPASRVRNLGVIFDSNMSFIDQVSSISKSVRYQLRNLGFIRQTLTKKACEQLLHALISSRLDFCNSILFGIPKRQQNRLQSLQNSSARLLTFTPRMSSITPVLHSLHWLPVKKRIHFKLMLLVHRAVHEMSPQYIKDMIHPYNPTRTLRSGSDNLLQIPRTRHSWGDRSFSHAAAKLWNQLPSYLRCTKKHTTFKEHLKTHLFNM